MDIVILLAVSFGVLVCVGYMISPKRKREVAWNGCCYVERFGGDGFVAYLNSEYMTCCPGGRRVMTVEVVQPWR